MNPSRMMKQTGTIYPGVETQDTTDGTLSHAAGTGVSTVCSVQPRSSREGMEFGRDTGRQFAVGYFPHSVLASLTVNGIIVVGSQSWRVTGQARDVGGQGLFVSVDLEAAV